MSGAGVSCVWLKVHVGVRVLVKGPRLHSCSELWPGSAVWTPGLWIQNRRVTTSPCLFEVVLGVTAAEQRRPWRAPEWQQVQPERFRLICWCFSFPKPELSRQRRPFNSISVLLYFRAAVVPLNPDRDPVLFEQPSTGFKLLWLGLII